MVSNPFAPRNSDKNMLSRTFQHIPGIGPGIEKRIWAAGATDWSKALSMPVKGLPLKVALHFYNAVEASIERLAAGDAAYFSEHLHPRLHWRMYKEFMESAAFFDIETTGLGFEWDEITTIALFDGKKVHAYVNGDNLDRFMADIDAYKLFVTFNGKCFDVPFVERFFGIRMPGAHIDLRYPLKRIGLTGGLKKCEKALSMDRGELDGVDGYFAVLLWREYKENANERALETLMAYNMADAANLHALMVHAYNELIRDTPFAETDRIAPPPAPVIPLRAHVPTVLRLKDRLAAMGGYET